MTFCNLLFTSRGVLTALALAVVLPTFPGAAGPAELSAQADTLPTGVRLRVTGATVLRGGPASPPVFSPVVLEGNAVGLRGDTLLLDIGPHEPVFWIPLSHDPLVERMAAVSDLKRSLIVGTTVSGLAGATFAWALQSECTENEAAVELGLADRCGEQEGGGRAALRGFAIGAGVGVLAGLAISRFAKRQAWVPVPPDGFSLTGGPTGVGLTVRLPTARIPLLR